MLSIPWPRERALFSMGRVSENANTSRAMSSRERERANSAGYWKTVNESPAVAVALLPHIEKAAPIMGPRRKPMEKAIPITACVCVCSCVYAYVCVYDLEGKEGEVEQTD